MSETNTETDEDRSVQPRRREKVRPFEIVGFSGVLAVFVAVIVIFVTDDLKLMAISAGIAFIAALMIFALLALSIRPSKEDEAARAKLLNTPKGGAH